MHIHALRIQNFRRLKDVHIDIDPDLSIFVGANNSGKTSTAKALQLFTRASRDHFSIHDFNAKCWDEIDEFGNQTTGAYLPKISIDIWFHVEANDIHKVIDLLPSLNWSSSLVGMRIEFAASDEALLLEHYIDAHERAQENIRRDQEDNELFHPSPRTLCEYLTDQLQQEFTFNYYVLDCAQFSETLVEMQSHIPMQITSDKGRSGKELLNSLLRVDFLSAQRHLSDSTKGSRAENLSQCLSRFYERNLEKLGDDFDAIHALSESEILLNKHLASVFKPVLSHLENLGYPGIDNPKLIIKTALNPATIMSNHVGTKVHYVLGGQQDDTNPPTLPDSYNGLGYKNLIYMVVELLDLHSQWTSIEENRPPLHLIFIEEPEVHLHAQLQQVFIREVLEILPIEDADATFYHSQLIVSTHSSHILYERGFQPIRYFRRHPIDEGQSSEILNLSAFYNQTDDPTRDFLERYLKLTHCDLFFADAAILVEGNVERILMPLMIEKAAPRLKSAYLSILEIGGAFGYRFKSLIEFLGITTLIITDIDSVTSESSTGANNEEITSGSTCMVDVENAVTSNQTLIQWLPGKSSISDLLTATGEDKTQQPTEEAPALIFVAYQTQVDATWQNDSAATTGRTLEVAFALENLKWCQDQLRADLKLRIPRNETLNLQQLTERIHKRVKGSSFKKTDFALALLTQDPIAWTVPTYIAHGLLLLQDEITPLLSVETTSPNLRETLE